MRGDPAGCLRQQHPRKSLHLTNFICFLLPKVTSSTCPPSLKITGSSSGRSTAFSSFWTLFDFITGEIQFPAARSDLSDLLGRSVRSITCDLSRAFRKNSNKESDLSEDDVRTIRASLCGLVKYYISKGMSQEEMHSILGYVAAIGDEDQVRGSAGVDPYP